ncbi:ATP12 family chaperone protein [Alphaproteobacteria bacterium LSUCC0684]
MKAAARRFWKEVDISSGAGGYAVLLDNRPVKTPSGAAFLIPRQELAEEISKEWDAQDEVIAPDTMPMFKFAVTAIDRVTPQRQAVVDEISGYGASDLLCYREASDAVLRARQDEIWQPFLNWFAATRGIELVVAHGIMPQAQSPSARERMRALVADKDDFALSGLHCLVTVSGSLVLGLAVADGMTSAKEVSGAAFLDDLWQQEKWGYDAEADGRIKTHQALIEDAERYLKLLT